MLGRVLAHEPLGEVSIAAEHGIALCKNEDLVIPREVERLRAYQAELAQQASPEGGSSPSRSMPSGNDLFAPHISHDTVGAIVSSSAWPITRLTFARLMVCSRCTMICEASGARSRAMALCPPW